MSSSLEIHDAVLALSDKERADLAYRLLQSIKPLTTLSADAPGFDQELDRRVQAYESGTMPAAEWDSVAQRLCQTLGVRSAP